MQKLRVGVLMGGRSCEKEVSFNSGRTLCDHLDTARYDVIPIFQIHDGTLYHLPWHFLHRGKSSDFLHRLPHEAAHISWDNLSSLVDFIYIAQHGRYAEDGILQGTLDVLGIPYFGSNIMASALGMDKQIQKTFLRMHAINTPRDIFLKIQDIKKLIDDKKNISSILELLKSASIAFPCVVKPHNEGSSVGVRIISSPDDLYQAIIDAATIHPEQLQGVLIEEKITGMEFTCITITDYKTGKLLALPPTEIVPETDLFDYEQKYMPGRATKFTPARCSEHIIEKIQQTCVNTMHALGITSMSRIDGFVTADEQIIIIDPNSFAGIAPSSFLFNQAAEINLSPTALINHLIETEFSIKKLSFTMNSETNNSASINSKRLRIAVLMGGASNEKEISLESGRNVFYKLSPQQYEPYPIFVTADMHLYELNQSLLVRNSTKEINALLQPSMRWSWHDLKNRVDFVFIGLHGGLGENGGIQGMLEMLNIPYNGSGVLASALCMDKFKTNAFLRQHGIDVPAHMLIDHNDWISNQDTMIENIISTLPFPLIIKPHDDGCSVMVQKVRSAQQLIDAINHIFSNGKPAVLIEECISGMELTVGVVGNDNPYALPPSQTVVASDVLSIEEKFLPGAGENQTPAPLPPATLAFIQEKMVQTFTLLGCKGYARIDCFYQNSMQSPTGLERVVILEINTLPGLTPATCIFHQAAEIGMRPMEFIDQIIQLGLQEHNQLHHQPAHYTQTSSQALSL